MQPIVRPLSDRVTGDAQRPLALLLAAGAAALLIVCVNVAGLIGARWLGRQRELADLGNAVIEGRDIGTVVVPGADVKIYLNADPKIRAHRRQQERPDIGGDALATDLRLRDESDAARMQPAEDAERIDTTELDVSDVVDRIEQLVRARVA